MDETQDTVADKQEEQEDKEEDEDTEDDKEEQQRLREEEVRHIFGGLSIGKMRCKNHDPVKDNTGSMGRGEYREVESPQYFSETYLVKNPRFARQCDECKIPFFKSEPNDPRTELYCWSAEDKEFRLLEKETLQKNDDGTPRTVKFVGLQARHWYKVSAGWQEVILMKMGMDDKERYYNVNQIEETDEYKRHIEECNAANMAQRTMKVSRAVFLCSEACGKQSQCSVGYCAPCYTMLNKIDGPGTENDVGKNVTERPRRSSARRK